MTPTVTPALSIVDLARRADSLVDFQAFQQGPLAAEQTGAAALTEVTRLMRHGHSRQTAIAAMKRVGWAAEE